MGILADLITGVCGEGVLDAALPGPSVDSGGKDSESSGNEERDRYGKTLDDYTKEADEKDSSGWW